MLWSVGGSGAQHVISFALLVYLAHVLTPRDFGLIATVSIGLDLGTRIARWGQVELLQQTRYRTDQARNQSLRLSLFLGCLFMILFLLAARPVGEVYRSAELTQLILLSAPVFLFSSTSSTAEAVLRSEFRFDVIAVRNTVTALVGAVVAVVLVKLGFGVIALAVQRVVQSLFASLWVWSAVRWRPRLTRGGGWSGQLFGEGTHIMVGTLLPLMVPRLVDFFVGFLMGPVQLGLMRVGMRINDFVGQLVVMPLVSVANTQLSMLSDDLAAMRAAYLRLTQSSAGLMCPSLVGLSLVAAEAIPTIFGAQWTGAVPFVQVIGLLGAVAPINYYFAPTMMALGQSRLVMRQGLIQVAIGFMLAWIGASISLLAVAVMHVARGVIVALWNLIVLRRALQLRLRDVAAFLAPPYIATLAMAAVVIIVRHQLPADFGMLARLLILSVAGAVAYCLMVTAGGRLGMWPAHAALTFSGLRRGAAVAE